MIFQIKPEDLKKDSSLNSKDIGKWCFLSQGCYIGFCHTREKAEELFWESTKVIPSER